MRNLWQVKCERFGSKFDSYFFIISKIETMTLFFELYTGQANSSSNAAISQGFELLSWAKRRNCWNDWFRTGYRNIIITKMTDSKLTQIDKKIPG